MALNKEVYKSGKKLQKKFIMGKLNRMISLFLMVQSVILVECKHFLGKLRLLPYKTIIPSLCRYKRNYRSDRIV